MAAKPDTTFKIICSGIFEHDEICLRFAGFLETYIHPLVIQLLGYAEQQTENMGPRAFFDFLESIIDHIPNWKDNEVPDILSRIKSNYDEIERDYMYTVLKYANLTKNESEDVEIDIKIPTIEEFLHRFICKVTGSDVVKLNKYKELQIYEMKGLFLDAIRMSLAELVKTTTKGAAKPIAEKKPVIIAKSAAPVKSVASKSTVSKSAVPAKTSVAPSKAPSKTPKPSVAASKAPSKSNAPSASGKSVTKAPSKKPASDFDSISQRSMSTVSRSTVTKKSAAGLTSEKLETLAEKSESMSNQDPDNEDQGDISELNQKPSPRSL